MSTLGSAEIDLNLNQLKMKFRIHVINSHKIYAPTYDGILGQDFFDSQKAEISYTAQTIKIANTAIPFINGIETSSNSKFITLPARSETIVQVPVNNKIKEGTVQAKDIAKNVLLSNAVVSTDKNSNTICSLINLSNEPIKIERPTLTLEEIEKPSEINFLSPQNATINAYNQQETVETLHGNLRTDHINREEKDSLVALCNQYMDIHYLPEDALTSTNTLKHEVPLNTNVPIATKTYRYRKVHEMEV